MKKLLAIASCMMLLGATVPPPRLPVVIPVTIDAKFGPVQSGRLIVFIKELKNGAAPDAQVDFDPFAASSVSIAAREVAALDPRGLVQIDGEIDAFPSAWSFLFLAGSTYEIQAVLDRNHDYNYAGRSGGDLVSKVVTVTSSAIPTLTLDSEVPALDEAGALARAPAALRPTLTTWLPRVKPLQFQSKAMTAFRGTPTDIRGWVALPPGYDGKTRFPTVYTDSGYGGSLLSLKGAAATMMADMASGKAPPMIWVYLDHSGATGTHEFADSANNGPWGTALTSELIPSLERTYRMDATPRGRFLTGHSSGGWSTLWLQVRYPKIFGGSWPTSPDPSDFHDFTGVDLYAANANFYVKPDGTANPLARVGDKAVTTMADYARSETVMGAYGGQMASFDWVFSPRGADGRPVPLFDRVTGKVDPVVAAYWIEHYDIARRLKRDWATLKPDLDGKIHLTVGTADTFYLDGPAHRLEAVMKALGAKTDFRYLPGKSHFDLYARGDDNMALLKDIAWEMYAVARPGSKRPN